MKIQIKKLKENAIIPTSGSEEAAGADLYACLNTNAVTIMPNETIKISTGIALAIPEGYVGLIFARSGLATKEGLAPANKVGVIDADYRGEIIVALHNHSNIERKIQNGERIAQIVITPFIKPKWDIVEELDDTERGAGGFGSTGKE